MSTYDKYIKYKTKYINLKGGFALTQECDKEPYNIKKETGEEIDKTFLYPTIEKYLTKKQDEFNTFLTAINKYSKENDTPSHSVEDIIKFFNSSDHMKLLEELLTKYINDDLENYHVQFSALIFISFILELELFMIFYTIIPYNISDKPYNNNFAINWENYGKIYIIYHELLKNNILEILNIFTCELEKKYKIFIETFITKMYEQIKNVQDSQATDEKKQEYMNIFYESFFKNPLSKDYRHIYKDWMTRFISNLKFVFKYSDETIKKYINESIINSLKKFKYDDNNKKLYNTNQIGLFDYIFQYKDNYSCITFSILEFYFLSRLHIKYEDLYLDLEAKIYLDKDIRSDIHLTTQDYTNTICTHWTCTFMNTKTRSALEVQRSFSFKNKAEILFSFIFASYDRYNEYIKINKESDKTNKLKKFKNFIDDRQKCINILLFTSKPIIISSMKINPLNTWKYMKNDYKDDPDIILEGIRYNILNFKSLYDSNKELYKEQKYILAALESKQLKYNDTKYPKFLEFASGSESLRSNSEIVKIAIEQNGLALKFASEEQRSNSEIVKIAVQQNGLALEFASESLKSDIDIINIAVDRNGLALKFASERLKSDIDIVKIAVQQNGLALEFASESLKSDIDIVNAAAQKNGLALEFASETVRRILDTVSEAVYKNGLALEFTSEILKNHSNIVIKAVKQNGLSLKFGSEKVRSDLKIIEIAVQQNGLALQYINEKIKNELLNQINDKDYQKNTSKYPIIILAIVNNALALEFIIKNFVKQFTIDQMENDIVFTAVERNGLALKFARKISKNNERIAKKAVEQNGLALEFVSKELRNDSNIVNAAVDRNGLALEFASERLRNDSNIVNAAVEQNGLALEFASERLRNDSKIVNVAVDRNGLALEFASERLKNLTMTVIPAVQQNGLALKFASEKIQNFSIIVEDAVKQNGLALEFASKEKTNDLDIVKAAVQRNGLALEFASEEKTNNFDIVKAAVQQNGLALEFASEEKTNNFDIVKAAVQKNGLALEFASEEKQMILIL